MIISHNDIKDNGHNFMIIVHYNNNSNSSSNSQY